MRPTAVGALVAMLLAGCSSGASLPATSQTQPASTPPRPKAGPAARPRRLKPVVTVAPLPPAIRRQLRARHFWHPGCPVSEAGLRVLTVPYWGFDRQVHAGQMVVNASAAQPLGKVFKHLYGI